ncbi:MAG: molybdate ABC transporter substrate-binding protein [Mariprofundaceae bacterium]
MSDVLASRLGVVYFQKRGNSMRRRILPLFLVAMFMSHLSVGVVGAEELRVACASNFLGSLKKIVARFNSYTGHNVMISSGSTGKLYAQIVHGAPYDIFMAADVKHPAELEKSGLITSGSRMTYAVGQLVLLGRGNVDMCLVSLSSSGVKHIAIANVKMAPYGLAAKQVLIELDLFSKLMPKLVFGENIAQVHQFIMSRNAQAGFIAASQLQGQLGDEFCHWKVPDTLHAPLKQQAVITARSKHQQLAKVFLEYLERPDIQALIVSLGYAPSQIENRAL